MNYYTNSYFDTLKRIAVQYVYNNYDYAYLDSMHAKNEGGRVKTIIAGSSHAMNGIVEEEIGDVINFSVSSQDIYCDYLHIRRAVENGKEKIQNCIINIGYYMLYQDLSLCRSSIRLMYQIYQPLFGDMHHHKTDTIYDLWKDIDYDRTVFSDELVKTLCTEWSRGVFLEQSSYYGFLKSREQNSMLPLSGIDWKQLDDEKRTELAIRRTAVHNHMIKYQATREESGQLIREMSEYLYDRKIRIIFLIMPFTEHYNRYINQNFKEDIYQLLDRLEVPVELLDMNDLDHVFDHGDFLDTDHLSLEGARKASRLLADYLENWK